MEGFISWISAHAGQAHWFIFGAILLAGFNVPVSIDVVLVGAAFLAATSVPEHVWHLYLAVFLGCYFSAWIAYGFGRFVARRLLRFRWFQKIFPLDRIEKIQTFYQKYGFWTFLVGRFIPFGVRNCIFMSSGMSRVPFYRFILWDLPACLLWSSVLFYIFFTLGKNFQILLNHLKIVNVVVFLAFGVTVITLLWYKRRKKNRFRNLSKIVMMSLSNSLSILRAPLAFLFLVENPTLRLIAILLAMVTDSIDGYLARLSKTTSRFGAVLDPAMDKFFVFFVLGVFFTESRIELWQLLSMVSRDFALCVFGLYLSFSGQWFGYEFRAIRWGKITTALQFVVLMGMTVGYTIPTFLFYAFIAFALLGLYELFQFKKISTRP